MFKLNFVTPEKKLLTDEIVEEVIVPAFMGELDIYPGHAPLMTTLSTGILKYKVKGQTGFTTAAVSWGYCQVHPHGVNILAETAETAEEIDPDRAKKSLEVAKKRLNEAGLTSDDFIELQRKIKKAQTRISVSE